MDKIIEDFLGMAQKNPYVAGVLAVIFGLYVVGKIDKKDKAEILASTNPTKPEAIEWAKIILAQNETINEQSKLINILIRERDEDGKV